MSLINDALKRAKQAQQQSPFRGQPAPPLEPAEDGAPLNRLLRFGLAVLLVATLALSGWFFWKWSRSSGERAPATRTTEVPPAKPSMKSTSPTAPQKKAIQVSTNIVVRAHGVVSARTESAAPVSTDVPVPPPAKAAAATPTTNVAAPALPPSPFADLKLQSIIFREDKPAAVISGEMLFVGDEIRGARILKIERQSVIVERNGDTNELRLPRL